MRFKELLEYKRDITATNLGTQLINAIAETLGSPFGGTAAKLKEIIPGIEISSRPDDDEVMWIVNELNTYVSNLLKYFEDADPTPNKQYTEWIVRRYIDGGIRYLEDVDSTVAENLAIYHELKTRRMIPPELMDINKFKGKAMMHFFRKVYNIYRELPDQVEKAKGNAKEFYDDADIRIVVPADKTAACYYGQGTQWCTASTKATNYFDHYNSQGPLYIIIPKKPEHEGEKYQLHFNDNQHMDENDNPILLGQILDVRFAGSDLIDFLMANEPSITKMIEFTPEHVLMDVVDILVKFTTDNLIPPIIEKLSEKNHVAYYDWLDEGGFLFKDSNNNVKVKDDAPKYLEFDGESKDAIERILFFVDMNRAEIMDVVDMDYDQDIHYSNDNVNYIISSKVQDAGWQEENQWIYDEVAEAIDNNITINMNYDDPNGSFKLNGFDVYAYEGNDQGYRLGGKDYT